MLKICKKIKYKGHQNNKGLLDSTRYLQYII